MVYKRPQQAGMLDRVFNSTIGLPQQVLWRIWRAIEDDKVDLFSEKGLFDAALIPILGIGDDHKEDVMPDYMAEQLGADKGQSGFGGQLAAAILTDPLTYMTGGLTALGKVGKAATAAGRAPELGNVLRKAAETSGKSLDDFAGNMKPEQLRGFIDEAVGNLAGKGGKAGKQRRTLQKAGEKISRHSQEAVDLAAKKGIAAKDYSVREVMKHTRDRQVAIGIPGLATLGVKHNVHEGYGSWWKVFKDGVGNRSTAMSKAWITRGMLGLPGIGAALKSTAMVPRQMYGGWKVGGEARIAISHGAKNMTDTELGKLQHWKDVNTGGSEIVPQLLKKKRKGKNQPIGRDRLSKKFSELMAEGDKTYEEAFKEAALSSGVGRRGETAAAIWGRLSGAGSEALKEFPTFSSAPAATKKLDKVLDTAIAQYRQADELTKSGKFNLGVVDTEHKKLAKIFEGEREQFDALRGIADGSFKAGEAFRKTINTLFKTGNASKFAEKEFATFLAHTARDNDQLEILTQALYTKLKEVGAKNPDWDLDDLSHIMGKVMEVEALPGELAASFKLAQINPSNAASVMKSLNNFTERQRRMLTVFEKMLKKSDVGTPEARQKMLDAFEDQVFPFLEREVAGAHGLDSKLEAQFSKLVKTVRDTKKVYTTRGQELINRKGTSGYTIRGGGNDLARTTFKVAPPQSGLGVSAPRDFLQTKVLDSFAGRHAGELTDSDLGRAIDDISSHAMRPLTHDEFLEAAKEIDVLNVFADGNKISVEEAIAVLGRTGKGQHRLVPRTALQPAKLWEASRTTWRPEQVEQALEPLGFTLRKTEDGDVAIMSSNLKEATLKRSYRWKDGPGGYTYTTMREAMKDMRIWLDQNPNYLKKYGPKPIEVKRPIKISTESIDALRQTLNADDLALLGGRTKRFDDSLVPKSLQSDYERMSEVVRRRQLPEGHRWREELVLPSTKPRVTDVGLPRTGEDMALAYKEAGIELPEGMLPDVMVNYGRGRVLIREVMQALRRADKYGMEVDIPPQLLKQIEDHMTATGEAISGMVMNALPKEAVALFDVVKDIQKYSFNAARESGVWIPGSPVGYLPRYFNTAARQRIGKIIGEVENADSEILMRLGVKQSQRFGRSLDTFTIDDLNSIHASLRKAMNEQGATEQWGNWYRGIEAEMETAGMGVAGLPKLKLPWTQDRITKDPFISLLQRLGASNQDKGLEHYFESVLSASGIAKGESMMLGGKVVGVIDDVGNTIKIKEGKRYTASSKGRKGGKETVALEERAGNIEYTPKGLIIEDAQGHRHILENGMLNETGLGILDLGAVGDAKALGYTPTLGKSFAQRALRSDLHEQLLDTPMQGDIAEQFLDHHVVFGASNLIASTAKTAARVHKVTAPALRTIDSVNFMIKSFQTIFRLPFHIANLSSGVFQASLAGASPRNITAAYADTFGLLYGSQEYTKGVSMLHDLMDTGSTSTTLVKVLPKADIQRAARMYGNGDLAKYVDELEGLGVNRVEDKIISTADGIDINVSDFIKLAGEMELYGTFASSLTRGSRTTAENLLRMKFATLDPSLVTGWSKKTVEGVTKALGGTPGSLREMSEVVNRTSTALALVREGHPMRRAIEIAKEAHVPYEKLTPFEKEGMKRVSMYYTFPRHYMPWAWARFAEDPKRLSALAHTIRDQNLLTSQEGKANLVMGDYRMDVGRLNANFEAAGMLAAVADRIALPVAEMVPGVSGVDARKLVKAQSDAGLTAGGGIGSILGFTNLLPLGDRTNFPKEDWMTEAVKTVWPIKMAAQLMGKMPFKSERSPFVTYTPFEEHFLTGEVFGLGARKVRDNHELINAQNEYRRQVKRLQLKAAATEDPETRQRYMGHVQTLTQGLKQLHNELQQKTFK